MSPGIGAVGMNQERMELDEATSNPLKMHVAPLASGSAVLADLITAGSVKEQHRQLAGIDMEAYSVFAAASESVLPQPKAFVLKSVVDFADPKKSDNYRDYASFTSAKETLHKFCDFA